MDIITINKLLVQAEKSERCARELRDQKTKKKAPALQEEIKTLFEISWQGYHEVEALARKYLVETDSIEGFLLLAQTLMDIHIHPNSGLEVDTKALWEAQYLWLHLYYRTGEAAYFEQAKFCDGIRHAIVKKIDERKIASDSTGL